jgi:hypothetical protein
MHENFDACMVSVRHHRLMAPETAVHYFRPGRPFKNLSDLELDELIVVYKQLEAESARGEHRRVFGRRYMELRRRTEAKLRSCFVAAGGRPERLAPHYFVFGGSSWFKGLADDMEEIAIAIAELPTEATSITYGDSFAAMALGPEYGLPYEPKPYHHRAFRIEDLDELVATYGMPSAEPDSYEGYATRPFEHYIEIQLWSDEPVERYLS